MTPARSVPTASAEHAVPDRVERLMSELKADLIQLARIPWVTIPESATRSDRPVVLVLAGVLVDARVDASVGLDYRAGIAMDPR